jgi:hypothetical protein
MHKSGLGIILLLLILTACSKTTDLVSCRPGETAIYLTAEQMSGAEIQKADLAKVVLAAKPVIAGQDIFSYSLKSHELRLSPEALKRISDMKVPLNGLAFVACADGEPALAGAFWTPLSSLSFDGVSILSWPVTEQAAVRLDWGYPAQMASMDDPRDNPRLIKALEKAGKLK